MANALAIAVKIRGVDGLSEVVKRSSSKASRHLDALEKKYGKADLMNTAMIAGGLYAVQSAFKTTLTPALEFEDAMVSVKSIAPGTFGSVAKDMEAIEGSARNWAKSHAENAAQFAQAAYQMLSAGLDSAQAIAATETAMAVAKGTMGETIPTAQLLATVYNTLGDKTKNVKLEMARLGDILVATQAQYQIPSMDALIQGMTYAVPAAVQFGMSVEETAAVIGQLNTMGLQGSMAGTAFAASMSKMNSAAKKLKFEIARTSDGGVDFVKTMENIKAKFGDQMGLPKVQEQMRKAFGAQGLRAITLMIPKIDDLKTGYEGVAASQGAMLAAQKTMEEATTTQLQIAKNNLSELSIKFGQVALPLVNDAIPQMIAGMDLIGQKWELVVAGMAAVTTAWLVKTLPPMMISSAQMIVAHPAIAGLVAAAAAAAAAAEIVESEQRKEHRAMMRKGNIGVFEGPGGAQAAMAALDREQAAAVAAAGGESVLAERRLMAERSVIAPPVDASVFSPEVAGNINITFANAPAGMQVNTIETNSPDLAIGIKGDTGKNKTGSGGL
jgi:TP901 family phage tail tape measure protein